MKSTKRTALGSKSVNDGTVYFAFVDQLFKYCSHSITCLLSCKNKFFFFSDLKKKSNFSLSKILVHFQANYRKFIYFYDRNLLFSLSFMKINIENFRFTLFPGQNMKLKDITWGSRKF